MIPESSIITYIKNNKVYYKIPNVIPNINTYKTTNSNITVDSEGFLHSYNDEPAIVNSEYKEWYEHGRIHRVGNPAHIPNSEVQYGYKRYTRTVYYHYGKIHRIGGPAVIDAKYNTEVWYYKGQIHRTHGPAYITTSSHEYRSFGNLHREDGPAIIITNNNSLLIPKESFYIHGCKATEAQYNAWKLQNFIKKSI